MHPSSSAATWRPPPPTWPYHLPEGTECTGTVTVSWGHRLARARILRSDLPGRASGNPAGVARGGGNRRLRTTDAVPPCDLAEAGRSDDADPLRRQRETRLCSVQGCTPSSSATSGTSFPVSIRMRTDPSRDSASYFYCLDPMNPNFPCNQGLHATRGRDSSCFIAICAGLLTTRIQDPSVSGVQIPGSRPVARP